MFQLLNFFKRCLYRRYGNRVLIAKSARLLYGFSVNFLSSKIDRRYVEIGANTIIGAKIIFESPQGFVSIGDRTFIGSGVKIISRSKVEIGNDVAIAWGAILYDHNSNSLDWRNRVRSISHFYKYFYDKRCYTNADWEGVKTAPIIIEDRVWIGFDAVIFKGVTIGEGAIVGARSVVRENVPPYTVVAGNPAVVIRKDLRR